MCREQPVFVTKSSPCHRAWCSFCRRGCRPQQVQKRPFMFTAKWHLRWMATSVRLFREMNMDVPFLSTRRNSLHSLTYIHYDGAEARMRRTPRHRLAKHLHEPPNYQVHTCCQYIGEEILAQLEDNRQTLREHRSHLRLLRHSLLTRASRARRLRAPFFNHSNLSQSSLCACVRSAILALDDLIMIRGTAAKLCAQVTPLRRTESHYHRNSALCIPMCAWIPWTRLNRPELFSELTVGSGRTFRP